MSDELQPIPMQDVIAAASPSDNGSRSSVSAVLEAIEAPPVTTQKIKTMRVKELSVPEGEYEGFRFRYWSNFPFGLQKDMQGNDEGAADRAFRKIIRWHSGWELSTGDFDDSGTEITEMLPQPDDVAFRDKLPFELLVTMMGLVLREVRELPPFLLRNDKT